MAIMEESTDKTIYSEYNPRWLPVILESHRYAVEVKTAVWIRKDAITETLTDFADILQDYKDIEDALAEEAPQPLEAESGEADVDFVQEAEGLEEQLQKELPSLFLQLQEMTVSKKIEFAMKCTIEARTILVRDSNRLVQMAVIKSPKITEAEVISIANNRAIHEDVLRYISGQRDWMKLYELRSALVFNPKTPLSIAMKLIGTLKEKELSKLGKSKGVPRALSITAVRRLHEVKR